VERKLVLNKKEKRAHNGSVPLGTSATSTNRKIENQRQCGGYTKKENQFKREVPGPSQSSGALTESQSNMGSRRLGFQEKKTGGFLAKKNEKTLTKFDETAKKKQGGGGQTNKYNANRKKATLRPCKNKKKQAAKNKKSRMGNKKWRQSTFKPREAMLSVPSTGNEEVPEG